MRSARDNAVFLSAALLAASCITLAAAAQDESDREERSGASESPATPPPRRLVITVHTRDNRGRVFCALWRGAEGYPTDRTRNVGEAIDRVIENRRAVCTITPVSPGEYAVALFHDENANNSLDRNIFGIPSEGTGASNDAYNNFGPPGYDGARFTYPANRREHRIAIHVRY